jgi:hypothetical protein
MTLPSYAADRRLLPADPDVARPTWIRQAAHRSHGSARHQKAAPATKSPHRTAGRRAVIRALAEPVSSPGMAY